MKSTIHTVLQHIVYEKGPLLSTLVVIVLVLSNLNVVMAASLNNWASIQIQRNWQINTLAYVPECRQWSRLEQPTALIQALQLLTDYQRAWLNLGRASWLRGRCTEANQAWAKALALASTDDTARLLHSLGMFTEQKTGSWSTLLRPQEAERYALSNGYALSELGDLDTAIFWYKAAQNAVPRRQTAQILEPLYQQAGDGQNSIEAWKQLAEALPGTDPDHWYALGKAFELENDWISAGTAYETGMQISQDPYEFWLQLAHVNEYVDSNKARTAYNIAADLRPDEIWPILGLGHLALNDTDFSEALSWYQEAEQIEPAGFLPKYHLGFLYFLQGDCVLAQEYFNQVLLVSPSHSPSLYHLSQCMYRTGDLPNAIKMIDKAISTDTVRHWQWALQLGDWQIEAGRRLDARRSYLIALEWNPREHEILKRLESLNSE